MLDSAVSVLQPAFRVLPNKAVDRTLIRLLGTQIPMLRWITPRVIRCDAHGGEIEIPLNRRTHNHMGCMYVGVMAAGADLAGGYVAFRQMVELGKVTKLLFKDMHADFLKRAEGNVRFTCNEGAAIRDQVQEAIDTGERVNRAFDVIASVPSKGPDPVARFRMTLSLKA